MPMHKHEMKRDTVPKNKMEGMNMKMDTGSHENSMRMQNMSRMEMDGMNAMSHSYSINLPMNRNGSGTGWLSLCITNLYGKNPIAAQIYLRLYPSLM
jgi:hypothetical protein